MALDKKNETSGSLSGEFQDLAISEIITSFQSGYRVKENQPNKNALDALPGFSLIDFSADDKGGQMHLAKQ